MKPLAGTITAAFSFDGASYVNLPTVNVANTTEKTSIGPETGFSDVAIKLTFTRSATDATKGPTLTRWQARAYAAPIRARVFSVPILLHHRLSIRGRDIYQDVEENLRYLEGLVNDASVISYQETNESYNVVVENVEWIPLDSAGSNWDWEGTAVITMRSIAD